MLLFCGTSYFTAAQSQTTEIGTERLGTTEVLWDLEKLSTAPAFSWLDSTSAVRSMTYESVPYEGKPTRVFAYYSNPDLLTGPPTNRTFPAVVLVHGGGAAFKEWGAVASVVLAHSWLLNRPEVDPEKNALTGISWGGYLTCRVASSEIIISAQD